jgi:hypothetical protein
VLRVFNAAYVADGSFAAISTGLMDVRSTLRSGARADIRRLNLCATSGLMYCSKQHRYSITSSTRSRNDSEMARPSALAVLRLITVSYRVGACTGRSAGLAPLRIRSTYSAADRYCCAVFVP